MSADALEVEIINRKKGNQEIEEYPIEQHKIWTMEEEKRNRLIQIAFKEFAKGYSLANTDEITKNAGISKGLLFHYFGSKKELFWFLIKYAGETLKNEYMKVVFDGGDFLENIRQVAHLSGRMSFENPVMYDFLGKAVTSVNEVFPEGIPKGFSGGYYEGMMMQIYKNTDVTLFKEGIDPDKARNIIIWTFKCYSDSLLAYVGDEETYKAHYDQIMKEIDDYLQILRKAFYK